MKTKLSSFVPSRRQFLSVSLPAGTLLCLGCKNLLAAPDVLGGQKATVPKHKFSENSGMTIEEVFKFSFENSIPLLQTLANDMGREKFLEMLKKAADENNVQYAKAALKDFPKRDLAAFFDWNMKEMNSVPFNKALTYEVVEKTDKAFEIKVTECLWAKILREMNAADIGYVVFCDPDNAIGRAFNPMIKGTNPKNLMKGDSVCIGRIVWEG